VVICVQTCSFIEDYAFIWVHVKGFCVQSCAIGERLREQREKLGLNQEELGQLGGVNRNTQGKYEKGERSPDSDYLSAVASAGLDVLYVLTGEHKPVSPEWISSDVTQMLELSQRIDKADFAVLIRMMKAFANANEKA
jgi:transcriptional regulator with XRE-family HTH domain